MTFPFTASGNGAARARALGILALLALAPACSRHDSPPPPPRQSSAPVAEPSASTPAAQHHRVTAAEEKLVALAIAKHGLTTLPQHCLSMSLVDEVASVKSIDVREKHGGACGGDPLTAPRLFTMKLDSATGTLWTDARSLNGEFVKLQ